MKPKSVDEAIQAVEGALLSDAGVYISPSCVNAYFKINQSYEEHLDWLEYLKGCLEELDMFSTIRRYEGGSGNSYRDGCFYLLRSRVYPWLTTQRSRWYPFGKKIVPMDLNITGVTLANWIMGDGGGYRAWSKRPILLLYTKGFDADSRRLLTIKLNAVGVADVTQRKDLNLCIGVEGTSKVITAVSSFTLLSFKYKLKSRMFKGKEVNHDSTTTEH